MAMQIVLDNVEEKIKRILLQFSKEFAKNGNPSVTLRFTGGWVRDKLLKRPSHDIDVAIDKATGEHFAKDLHAYMIKLGLDEIGVHKIASNPDKSKHLETATTRICGLDVDFVNLRSEEYVTNSRIPHVTFGTPLQDALRRDATLNALFYNLSTDKIEDFTNRGLDDLKNGILRTPLNPCETFADDPLRVLRFLRFVGQLGFEIAHETLPAMNAEFVGDLLLQKVSAERVGLEMTKLLTSEYPCKAMSYLLDLGLGPYVFSVPEILRQNSVSTGKLEVLTSENLQSHLRTFSSVYDNDAVMRLSAQQKCILWLAVLLQDLRFESRGKEDSPVSHILKNSLKMSNAVKECVLIMLRSSSAFDNLQTKGNSRQALGLYVRNVGPEWELSVLFNMVRLQEKDEPLIKARNIMADIESLQLAEAYKLKPLVNGKHLAQLLNRKPGAWLAPMLQKAVEYQLANPHCTIADVEAHLVTDKSNT